jgi:hypothetical protein
MPLFMQRRCSASVLNYENFTDNILILSRMVPMDPLNSFCVLWRTSLTSMRRKDILLQIQISLNKMILSRPSKFSLVGDSKYRTTAHIEIMVELVADSLHRTSRQIQKKNNLLDLAETCHNFLLRHAITAAVAYTNSWSFEAFTQRILFELQILQLFSGTL